MLTGNTDSPYIGNTNATSSASQPAQEGSLLTTGPVGSGGISSVAASEVYAKPEKSRMLAEESVQTATSAPSALDPTLGTSSASDPDPVINKRTHSRLGSKSSATDQRRNGSAEIVRRSVPEQPLSAGTAAQSVTTAPTATPKFERKKKRGVARLISKLNCCGGSEDASAIDLDEHAVSPRKTSKVVSGQARQPTPVKKPNTSAAESNLTESKEMTEEKIGGPPYSTLKSAGEPKFQETPKSVAPMALPNPQSALVSNSEDQQIASEPPIVSQQTTAAQPNVPILDTKREVPEMASPAPQSGSVIVVPPAPTLPTALEQESVVDDRTPLQENRDSDIDMVDAPLLEPVADEPQRSAERNEAEVEPPLPPPPPLVPRAETSAPRHDRSLSNNVSATNEQQKWLLPPIKPEFRGKKCLVLDLDETLVHSSFKVGHPGSHKFRA